MKLALIFVFSLAGQAFAKEVTPKSFGVQYLYNSIAGQPLINFNITVSAADLQPGNFTTLTVTVVDAKDPGQIIAPAWAIYRKGKGTTIVGSEVFPFSYDGVPALRIMKALRNSQLIFNADNGLEMSINLAQLCKTNPDSFLNLAGGAGCAVDEKAIDKLLSKTTEQKPDQARRCNDEKSLKDLVRLACSDESSKKKIEAQSDCLFVCP